jgi:hypothetical protein
MSYQPTAVYALPYPQSGDHTRTWEHWQALADAVDALLAGKSGQLKFASNDIVIGDAAVATDRMLILQRLGSAGAIDAKYRVYPTAGGVMSTVQIDKAGVEAAQLNYREDGTLYTKSGGASGKSRPVPFAMWSGFVNVSVSNISLGTAVVNFPAGRFTTAPDTGPLIVCGSTNSIWMVGCQAITNASCTIYARSYNNTNGGVGGAVGVHLWAVQMTPTAAADPSV